MWSSALLASFDSEGRPLFPDRMILCRYQKSRAVISAFRGRQQCILSGSHVWVTARSEVVPLPPPRSAVHCLDPPLSKAVVAAACRSLPWPSAIVRNEFDRSFIPRHCAHGRPSSDFHEQNGRPFEYRSEPDFRGPLEVQPRGVRFHESRPAVRESRRSTSKSAMHQFATHAVSLPERV